GKPLKIESWDAAWVFVKFRKPETRVFSHATLSQDVARHAKPAGAALDMGLSDDGTKGIGVFIYRDAVGQGANEFKGIKLRWQNGVDQADGATAEFSIHAIPMVYVPDGAFRSKSPFIYTVTSDGSWSPNAVVCPLTTIDTPDTTKPSGHVNSSTNYVREGPDWPNGYGAFYCMKYSLSQGVYARFLTEAAPDPITATYNGEYGYGLHNAYRRYAPGLYGLCGYTIRYSAGEMRYEADVPERPANFLSDADIHSFTAWAGLRPMTCLEYEKACRGPRAVARDEDVWAPGACAPAAGLAQFVSSIGGYQTPTTGRLAWPGLSYWGIRDLSQSGAVIEWPAVVKEDGRGFTGNHGTGTPDPPGGWVFTSGGEWIRYMWQGFPLSQNGIWVLPEDCTSLPGDIGAYSSTRSGRYGARAVRTAARSDKDLPLQVDALQNLVGYDLAIVNLSGRFKNDSDKPLKVELVSSLPASSFLRGAASRGFTAAAKAVTPFKIPVVLTRAVTQATKSGGRGLLLPMQIKGPGGETLGEATIRLSSEVLTRQPGAVQSLAGGKIDLKMTNATENLLTLALEMPSLPAVRIGESTRTLTVAAGAEAVVAFPVPRQGLPGDGVCQFPFRVAVAGGAPQSGTVAVELSNKTRWWITQRSEKAPNLDALDTEAMPGAGDRTVATAIASGMAADAEAVFKAAKLPAGWTQAVHGAQIQLGSGGPLPSHGAVVIAATRLTSPTERDVIFLADHQVASVGSGKESRPLSLMLRIVLNGQVLCETRSGAEKKGKPDSKAVHLRKGVSTLLLVCQSFEDTPVDPGVLGLKFTDAKGGKPVSDLLFDMEKKE
ncbi:MAG: hypothetical protein ACOYOU_15620, partial [Kiritimatiellia bacterium]